MTEKVADDRGASDELADKEFSEIFDKASKDEPKAELTPAPVEKPTEIPAPAPAAEVKPDAGPEAKPTVETPQSEELEKAEQRYKTLQGIHRKDKETYEAEKAAWEAERAALTAKIEKPPAPAPKKEPTLADLYDSLSDEEKAELKGYDEEFDVISKMEGKKRDIAMAKLLKEIQTFKDEVLSQLAPVQTFAKESQEAWDKADKELHFSSLKEAHPDYEKYRDDGTLLKWIESKPKYLQPGMRQTYERGVVEDVIQLISDFKNENNIAPTQDNVVALDNEKAKKKLAMTAVRTGRSAVNPAMTVPTDFEGSWDEAMKKQGG